MKKLVFSLVCLLTATIVSARDIQRVACLGNSITKGSWLVKPQRDAYPAVLQQYLGAGYEVDNWGLSAARATQTAKTAYIKSDICRQALESQPQIVTILLGTDDSRKPYQGEFDSFKPGLIQLVKQCQALPTHPKVYLLTPPAIHSVAWDNDSAFLQSHIVPAVKTVAAETGATVIDLNAITQSLGRYYPDGIHPDVNGAGRLAAAIYTGITGKSKQYKRPLSLPTIFTDHAVLQQQSDAAIWGWGAAGQKVTVKPSWSKAVTTTADADGNWRVRIPTRQAGYTKYSIHISQGSQRLELHDILFGEVWFAAGQSNMQMELGGYYSTAVDGGPEAIANSTCEYLRFYRVPHKDCARPLDDVNIPGWEVSGPAAAVHFSATAFFFARQLQRVLNIPVGVIQSAYGGASINSFMTPDVVHQYSYIKDPDYKDMYIPKYWETYTWAKHTPTVVYNAMVHPVQGYNIKGAIWYQGEDDRRHPDLYPKMFESWLRDYQAKWQCGKWPIYYAQIAPYDYNDQTAAPFRECQEKMENPAEGKYMICLMDNGLEKNIHPSDKPTVGFRFAQRVLDKTYGITGINSTYPHFKSLETRAKDGKIILHFTGMDDGVAKKPYKFEGFQVSDNSKQFYNVKEAKGEGATIVLTPPDGIKPVAVRYCWKDYQKGTVYNMRGLPLSSFRTDQWNDVK